MVKEEILNERLVRHYSDAGLMLRQVETGIEYGEAVDVLPCRYTYEETDKSVELSDSQALYILTGGAYGEIVGGTSKEDS